MRRLALAIVMAALMMGPLGVTGCGSTDANGSPSMSTGSVQAFEAQTIENKLFSLGDHLGKDVIMVSFWATWCEPCKAEMPTLQKLQEKYADHGFTVVSVSMDAPDTQSGVKPYIRRQGYTFPVMVDEDTAIAQALNPSGNVPFTVLINRDGNVSKQISGFQPSEAASLEREVKGLLGLGE
ncbi:MAG: peroxiredoxin [Myxococcota bacterium]|jgi:peroxiredoxin